MIDNGIYGSTFGEICVMVPYTYIHFALFMRLAAGGGGIHAHHSTPWMPCFMAYIIYPVRWLSTLIASYPQVLLVKTAWDLFMSISIMI